MIEKGLKSGKNSIFYNFIVNTGTQEKIVVDFQFGFFNDEKTEMFLLILPQQDTRLQMAQTQIRNSPRAEAILNYDENLSIVDCNEAFYKVFECNEELCHSHFNHDLMNGFLLETREYLMAKIQETLKKSEIFSTEIKVLTANGEEKWYRFDLQKRELDNTGKKLMCYMVNIEKQVELKAEHSLLIQQLSAMQELTDDILYHIDVKKGILYHNIDLVRGKDAGYAITDFVKFFVERQIVHSEDAETYQNFLKDWYSVKPTQEECTIRASIISDEYQWYTIRGKKIYDENGVLTNVLGALVNVQKETELVENYATLNHIFTAFQKLSEDILFRIDVKTGSMFQTGDTETAQALGKEIPDYVNTLLKGSVIHGGDTDTFLKFTSDILEGLQKECQVRVATSPTNYDWFQISVEPFYDEENNIVDLFGKMVNIQGKKDLERNASHDLMTSVLNKVSLRKNLLRL